MDIVCVEDERLATLKQKSGQEAKLILNGGTVLYGIVLSVDEDENTFLIKVKNKKQQPYKRGGGVVERENDILLSFDALDSVE